MAQQPHSFKILEWPLLGCSDFLILHPPVSKASLVASSVYKMGNVIYAVSATDNVCSHSFIVKCVHVSVSTQSPHYECGVKGRPIVSCHLHQI